MRLFGNFRQMKNAREDKRQIIGISLLVRGGSNPLPGSLLGAYVTGFSFANNSEEAMNQTVKAIFSMGYDVEEVIPKSLHISMSGWGNFISAAWPEFRDHFPTQTTIEERLANRNVVFSPFAGFDQSSKP